MNQIKFINREVVGRTPKTTVLKKILLVCAIFITVGNLILVLTGGWGEISIFSGVILPAWIWFSALRKPSAIQEEIQVEEELVQTDDGVCIIVGQIDRGDRFGLHSERIVCSRDRIINLIYRQQWNMIEIVGRPIIYFYKEQQELVLDTMKEFDEDYVLRIHCTEENKSQIMQILQNGLRRIAIQQ